jgi:hypothetical protein
MTPPYRAWLYHATELPMLCTSHAQYLALLDQGWVDSPAKVQPPEPEPVTVRPTRGRPRKDT